MPGEELGRPGAAAWTLCCLWPMGGNCSAHHNAAWGHSRGGALDPDASSGQDPEKLRLGERCFVKHVQ